MDASGRVMENAAVAVRGSSVAAVGAAADLKRRYPFARLLDLGNSVVLPGLVNAHTHAPMALLRGLADDVSLQDWLTKYIFPAEKQHVNPEFVRWGTLLACVEMLRSGVTTFADMYYFEETVAQAAEKAGMRAVLGQTIIRFPVPDAASPKDGLARAERFILQYRKHPLITPAVAPHALYTNDPETLKAARALANRFSVPLLLHLAETEAEDRQARQHYGVSPTQQLDRWGILNGLTLAAHAVWVDEADRRTLAQHRTGVAHCPSSNMKLASGMAPVMEMLAAGIAVGLGTDGPAGSNNDFNLFEEMDLAAKLQKVRRRDPRALSALQALEMATRLGAQALGLEKQVGSLEPGKQADLIAVTLEAPHAVPLFNVISHLVYAAKACDVTHVWIGGRLVMEQRRVLTVQEAAVLAQGRRLGLKIQNSKNF